MFKLAIVLLRSRRFHTVNESGLEKGPNQPVLSLLSYAYLFLQARVDWVMNYSSELPGGDLCEGHGLPFPIMRQKWKEKHIERLGSSIQKTHYTGKEN